VTPEGDAPAGSGDGGDAPALRIVHLDDDLAVIDKPAGLVVHPAPSHHGPTLVSEFGDLLGGGDPERPGIVHRLDKDTSGIMVVAKTQFANTALTLAFAARDIDRAYLALVWGLPNPPAGDIQGNIGRDSRDRKRMAVVVPKGKPALTRYRTLRAWSASVAHLECRLATGRTHQIRVHLASRGNPVVGDPLYLRRVPVAARALPEPVRRRLLDFPRQALHAARLGFAHPRTGQALSFTTEPPADMTGLIASLDCDLRAAQV
jgi:23S rRNA pseudouridine1911/1915/1917 synthase